MKGCKAIESLDALISTIDTKWNNLEILFAEVWNVPWTIPAKQRDDFEIHLVEKGKGRYFVGDKEFDVSPGSILILSSAEGNSFIPNSKEFRIIFVTFRFKDFNTKVNSNTTINIENYEKIQEIFHKMSKVKSLQLPKYKFELKILFSQLVFEIYTKLMRQQDSNNMKSKIHRTTRSKIDKVILYLYKNYKHNITLEELANEIELHPRYLCVIFKSITGRTINNYLTSIKVEKAKKLLRNTNIPITEIAYDVGFGSSQYFSRVFKKAVGCIPREYRNRINN